MRKPIAASTSSQRFIKKYIEGRVKPQEKVGRKRKLAEKGTGGRET